MQNVSYITGVPLAVCDMSFDFPAVTTVCLFMYTFLLSCTASIIWQKTSQTTRKICWCQPGFSLWTCRISMKIVFVWFCKKKRRKKDFVFLVTVCVKRTLNNRHRVKHGEIQQNIIEKLMNYFLFITLWIIQLYSLLYGLYEILNKKYKLYLLLNYWLMMLLVIVSWSLVLPFRKFTLSFKYTGF